METTNGPQFAGIAPDKARMTTTPQPHRPPARSGDGLGLSEAVVWPNSAVFFIFFIFFFFGLFPHSSALSVLPSHSLLKRATERSETMRLILRFAHSRVRNATEKRGEALVAAAIAHSLLQRWNILFEWMCRIPRQLTTPTSRSIPIHKCSLIVRTSENEPNPDGRLGKRHPA